MATYGPTGLCEKTFFQAVKEKIKVEVPRGAYLVVEFYEAPELYQKFFDFNGGDEDFLVLYSFESGYNFPDYFYQQSEPDQYDLGDGVGAYVYSHS